MDSNQLEKENPQKFRQETARENNREIKNI